MCCSNFVSKNTEHNNENKQITAHAPESVVTIRRNDSVTRRWQRALVNVAAPRPRRRRQGNKPSRTRAHITTVRVAALRVGPTRKIETLVDVGTWARGCALTGPARTTRALERPREVRAIRMHSIAVVDTARTLVGVGAIQAVASVPGAQSAHT